MTGIQTQVRTPWQVMCASIYTLIVRNIEIRFVMKSSSKRFLDLLFIFSEPVGHVMLWTAVRLFRNQPVSSNISPVLFILLGVMPWLFTYNTINDCLTIIVQNRGLLFFRQIKPLDPVIALVFSELITMALVFCCALFLLLICNIPWHLQSMMRWGIAVLLYIVFIMGMAIFMACLGFFSKPVARLVRIPLRVLYLFSGIFFSAEMLPTDVRHYFVINPLFQFIEISRGCFSNSVSYDNFGDLFYLFECAIVSMALGLGFYTASRKKMMIEIMEH